MANLKIEITKNFFEVYELNKVISIGSAKDENDIVLDENSASPLHARIFPKENNFSIEAVDQNSKGFHVNGNKYFSRILNDKDTIRIGKTKLYFFAESWDTPEIAMDLTKSSISDYQEEKLIEAKHILFRIPSKDEPVAQVQEIIRKKFSLLPISEKDKINFETVLSESIGNAHRHGNKYNPELHIDFRYFQNPEKIVLQVTDQGSGFDYKKEFSTKKKSNPVEEAINRYNSGGYGGLGIMMILKCANKVEYNKKGNQVTLTKYLNES